MSEKTGQGTRNTNYSNRSRNRRRPKQSIDGKYVTKRSVHGGQFSPGPNPPNVTYQPWQALTLVFMEQMDGTQQFSCTPTKLAKQLKAQLDPNGTSFKEGVPILQFRISSIRSWNLTGKTLALSVDDYSDIVAAKGARDQVCGLVDTGTSLHVPAIGYQLPASLKNVVIRNDSNQGEAYLFSIFGLGTSITYVATHWRMDGPVKVPTFNTQIDHILNANMKIQKDTHDISESCQAISEHTKSSLLQKTVDGISVVAQVVAPVAGAEADETISLLRQIATSLSLRSVPTSPYEEINDDEDDDH